jgi:hypothetical protein
MISIKETAVVGRIPVCSARVTCDDPEGQLDPFQNHDTIREWYLFIFINLRFS